MSRCATTGRRRPEVAGICIVSLRAPIAARGETRLTPPTTGLNRIATADLSRGGLSGVAGRARVELPSLFACFPDSSAPPERDDRARRDAPARAGSNGATGVTPCADPIIVDERGVARVRQRERCRAACRPSVEDGGRAAHDVLAADQQHQHEIDAVAMHAFRRRMARRLGARLDAELMHLDVPPRSPDRGPADSGTSRLEMREEAIAPAQDRRHRLARGDVLRDRLEPSLDTAEQLVVFLTLIVRLMRLARDAAARVDRKHRIPPPPIPAVTGKVRIDLEVIPARRERRPVGPAARTTPAPRACRRRRTNANPDASSKWRSESGAILPVVAVSGRRYKTNVILVSFNSLPFRPLHE